MRRKLVIRAFLTLLFWFLIPAWAGAQQRSSETRTGKFRLGLDIGSQLDTADGGAFALGLSGDYFLDHNFSIGPLLQIGVSDDLFQFAPTVQGKFTFDLPGIPQLKPNLQAGIGLIYADVDRRFRPDRDDTSFLIPIGFGADYRLNRDVSVGSTLLLNFTDLRLNGDEHFFVTWLVGMKVHF